MSTTKLNPCSRLDYNNVDVVKYIMFTYLNISDILQQLSSSIAVCFCVFCTSHPRTLRDSARVIEEIIEVKPIT